MKTDTKILIGAIWRIAVIPTLYFIGALALTLVPPGLYAHYVKDPIYFFVGLLFELLLIALMTVPFMIFADSVKEEIERVKKNQQKVKDILKN